MKDKKNKLKLIFSSPCQCPDGRNCGRLQVWEWDKDCVCIIQRRGRSWGYGKFRKELNKIGVIIKTKDLLKALSPCVKNKK
ncbi:hypothetical protein KKG58_02810 [Patescibacteria group bacterium]|nr:hypothetical protein [Patescibacteria group bacterium]